MEQHKIWGYCNACEAPLVEGMKLNLAPCPGHPGEKVAYCDQCVRDAESRLKARKEGGTMADQFVYKRAYSDQGLDFAVAYRITKRTKTRIYVDRNIIHNVGREHWDQYPEDRHCFTLDRATFERDGRVYCPSRGETFYATEAQAIGR